MKPMPKMKKMPAAKKMPKGRLSATGAAKIRAKANRMMGSAAGAAY